MNGLTKVAIEVDKCKGCLLCVYACPNKCLEVSGKFNKSGYHPAVFVLEEKCTSCGFCYQTCPDACIEVYK